jgi:hypothetical protein
MMFVFLSLLGQNLFLLLFLLDKLDKLYFFDFHTLCVQNDFVSCIDDFHLMCNNTSDLFSTEVNIKDKV